MATHPKFVRWALLIGIVIALNLFFVAARSLVIAEPQYDDFCPTGAYVDEEMCIAQGGMWVQDTQREGLLNKAGYCELGELYQKCQPVYEDARADYEMYAFVLMVGLGVLSLIAGVIPMGSSIVSSGLSYGGVLALLIAAGGYWGEAGNLVKLGMSLVALIALIYVGIKRFRD